MRMRSGWIDLCVSIRLECANDWPALKHISGYNVSYIAFLDTGRILYMYRSRMSLTLIKKCLILYVQCTLVEKGILPL